MEETMPMPGQPEPKLSFFSKLIMIFSNPSKVFANLKLYPDWFLPLLVIIVISIISSSLIKDIIAKDQKQAILDNDQMSQERKELMIQGMEKGGAFRSVMSIVGPVFIFIPFLVVAGVFYLSGSFVFGGNTTFKTIFSVYTWGYMVSILETIIKVPLMLAKNSTHVYTSLAVLFDQSESKTLAFKLANAIDLFSIWRLFLWGLGISIIYKFSQGKAYGIVIFWYIVWTLIVISISSVIPMANM
jgi:hypothetical protein